MTSAEHYAEAERLIGSGVHGSAAVAEAQVHAILALAGTFQGTNPDDIGKAINGAARLAHRRRPVDRS